MKAAKEFRALSASELNTRLRESKKELLKLNTQTGANPGSKVKQTKKNIARLLTILREQEGRLK